MGQGSPDWGNPGGNLVNQYITALLTCHAQQQHGVMMYKLMDAGTGGRSREAAQRWRPGSPDWGDPGGNLVNQHITALLTCHAHKQYGVMMQKLMNKNNNNNNNSNNNDACQPRLGACGASLTLMNGCRHWRQLLRGSLKMGTWQHRLGRPWWLPTSTGGPWITTIGLSATAPPTWPCTCIWPTCCYASRAGTALRKYATEDLLHHCWFLGM